jgi:phosphoserine aminotransferase
MCRDDDWFWNGGVRPGGLLFEKSETFIGMISFYPGPSRVHDEVPQYVKEAHKKGIFSINHRSDEFMNIAEKTTALLKKKLNIPDDYTVLFTSSATECWEIIAQSLIKKKSYHLFNGAFGQKWYDYTKRIAPGVRQFPFEREEVLNAKKFGFSGAEAIICITQNETSNGTQVSDETIRSIKENNPGHLLAIDATSSMAGIALDFTSADIWFASVQKCFGLPAGLGIMACSPETVALARKINEKDHYNSLPFMIEMMNKWQTPFTPNVMDIYLLMRVMKDAKPIEVINKKLKKRYYQWVDFFELGENLQHLVKNKDTHSYTVIPVSASPDIVDSVKKNAKKKGLLLGEGYGDLKSSTFRIANFPAIKKTEIEKLKHFLRSFV